MGGAVWDKVCMAATLSPNDKSLMTYTNAGGGARSLAHRYSGKWHFEINIGPSANGVNHAVFVGIHCTHLWNENIEIYSQDPRIDAIYGYPGAPQYRGMRLSRIAGSYDTPGFNNNAVVGVDVDADNNTLRFRTSTMDATYTLNGRKSTDPIYAVSGTGTGNITDVRLIAMPPFTWTPMDGYLPFGQE